VEARNRIARYAKFATTPASSIGHHTGLGTGGHDDPREIEELQADNRQMRGQLANIKAWAREMLEIECEITLRYDSMHNIASLTRKIEAEASGR
jgi:hypothetical protein